MSNDICVGSFALFMRDVIAAQMTVGLCRFPMSFCIISTGLTPPCSEPTMRNTAEETEVVPNLMIGFGIDEVQAEYVAEIKLRHLNREYILKRTEEIEELENAIADLEDILKRPARINKIIMKELGDVAKKYGKPVIAFSGAVTEDAAACNQAGIDAFFPILRQVTTLEAAMSPATAIRNMTAAVEQTFRLLKMSFIYGKEFKMYSVSPLDFSHKQE